MWVPVVYRALKDRGHDPEKIHLAWKAAKAYQFNANKFLMDNYPEVWTIYKAHILITEGVRVPDPKADR